MNSECERHGQNVDGDGLNACGNGQIKFTMSFHFLIT